jgi:hypothetical protein
MNTPIARCLFVHLLALLAGAAAAADDFERRCESTMKPVLDVRLHEYGYRVVNTVSSKVLNNRGLRSTSSGDKVLGLTTAQTRTEVNVDAPSLTDTRSGRECAAPKVSVDLYFPKIDVYVAREFSPVSCSYRLVLAHEMRHVDLYRDFQPQLISMIESELRARWGNHPVYATPGDSVRILGDYVDQLLRPRIQSELAKVEENQAEIDSDAEVFKLSNACSGEVAQLMGNRL